MRLPKRGEKGFTLIELLIVVAILGVLAAVVIPNVTRFVGAGTEEAAETELHNIQLAVTSMMLENGLTEIPNALNASVTPPTAQTNHRNDMGVFPDIVSAIANGDKVTDPGGYLYEATDEIGYRLYGHDITGGAVGPPVNPKPQVDINYVTVQLTTYYYTCEADGTVQQWAASGLALEWD